MFAKNDATSPAKEGGIQRFVAAWIAQKAGDVDAGLMSERRRADDWFRRGDGPAGGGGHKFRQSGKVG
jgi:hypothetical protein